MSQVSILFAWCGGRSNVSSDGIAKHHKIEMPRDCPHGIGPHAARSVRSADLPSGDQLHDLTEQYPDTGEFLHPTDDAAK